MNRETVNAICRAFPGAEVSDPWGGGHDAWKVGGRMFALIGAVTPGVSVKTDSVETAEMLIEAGVGVKTFFRRRTKDTTDKLRGGRGEMVCAGPGAPHGARPL